MGWDIFWNGQAAEGGLVAVAAVNGADKEGYAISSGTSSGKQRHERQKAEDPTKQSLVIGVLNAYYF